MIIATFGSNGAFAQDVAAAEALFNRGLDGMKHGHYEVACPSLSESYRLDPRPGTLFTLADCERKAGKSASAMAHYDDYLRLFAKMTPEQRVSQRGRDRVATQQRAAIGPEVPELRIVLPTSAPVGTVVKRDGQVLGSPSLGASLPIDPGEHTIVTQAPGGPEHEQRVVLARREKKTIEVEVVTPPVETTAAAPATPAAARRVARPVRDDERGPTTQRTAGFALAGLGLAGVAVGAAAGVVTFAKKADVDANCTGYACNAQGKAAADAGKRWAAASTVAFAAGAGAIVLGTILIVSAPHRRAFDSAPRVGASVGPSGASIGAGGVW